jgi:1,4-dihydroxy-2-naphthoate octaprenyltransferase
VKISLVQALTAMPRVSPSAWRATPLAVRWLISARASVLVMTFTAAAFGGLLTIGDAAWSLTAWTLCTAGLLLAHAANNQLNDLTDSIRGIDEGNYFRLRYGAHVLEDGLLSRRALILYMCVTGGLAALCGVYLLVTVSTGLIVPFLLGSLLLLFYTWPLKQWGLGELAVLLVWGPLMVGGTAFATTGTWDWRIALIGTAFALGPTTVIFGKHIDKLSFDREKGVATLPVRLGDGRARVWVQGMLAAQYLLTGVLVALGWLPWPVLIVLLAVPRLVASWNVFSHPAPTRPPDGFPESAWPLWFSAYAFDHTRWFSLLLLAGYCLALLL